MNIEKMFDPNSYTEKAMPFITALNYVFEDCNHSELDRCSDAVMEFRNKKKMMISAKLKLTCSIKSGTVSVMKCP